MASEKPAESDYFGRRLRDHNMVAVSEDDDAIAALLDRLMMEEWIADRPAAPAI